MQQRPSMINHAATKRATVLSVRGGWRLCVALVTALTFAFLITTSASHYHKTAQAAHDCVVCGAVVDKVTDVPAPLAHVHRIDLASYHILLVPTQTVVHASPILLPPSCGPPHAYA